MSSVGRRIQGARHDAGYRTAEDFAAALGVKVGTVYSWENPSKDKEPRKETLERIAELTGRSVAYLLTGEDEPSGDRITAALERTQRELEELRRQVERQGVQPGNAPDHVGVRILAADAELCQRWRITPEELHELSTLVILRGGQPVSLQTAQDAIAALQVLRSIPPA